MSAAFWPSVLATVLFLVPVGVIASDRYARPSWELGLGLPFAVAIDLLSILLLSTLVRLEVAVIVSRGAWLALATFRAARWGAQVKRSDKRSRGAAPTPPSVLLAALVSAGAAFSLSYALSRPYAIWDRELHIPAVSSLRGQSIPFASPYEPGSAFHYHFTGDVLGSVLQVLSGNALHASLALSLAHDLIFALTAASITLLLRATGKWKASALVIASLGMLLVGPCVLRGKVGEPYLGYSYYAPLIWGFRPHQHLASFLSVGFVGSVFVRLLTSHADRRADTRTLPVLLSTAALLAVTDESVVGMLGVTLGITWLINGQSVADTRRRGVVVFVALLSAVIGVNLLFHAALSPGGPVQKLSWIAARSPGVQLPPLPLRSAPGLTALVFDLLPTWCCAVGAWLASRALQARARYAVRAFDVALFGLSVLGLTHVDVNGAPPESHRFLTAALFVLPLLALTMLPRLPIGSPGRLIAIGGLSASAFSTLLWLSHYSAAHCTPESHFRQRAEHNLHELNCRTDAGTRLGIVPKPTYVETSVFYAFAGCYPVYAAGVRVDYWPMKMYPNLADPLAQLDANVPGERALDAICPAHREPSDMDQVCRYALGTGTCQPQGSEFLHCTLSPDQRKLLLKGS